ncbi:MAG: carboxy-S-adenosyl-L-methionine synthase CmoA [Mariprofundales bacterium]
MTPATDTLFQQRQGNQPFSFDHDVATVFPDMIRRSVPGYGLTLEMIAVLAEQFARDGSQMYDLGCSLGATSLAMRAGAAEHTDCRIIAVDNSPAMLSHCRQHLTNQPDIIPIHLVCADIKDIAITNASLVVLNFTLQFIPHQQRLPLLRAIRCGLNPGGVLLISEKVTFENNIAAQDQTVLHEAFKRHQGYSELEISRKREALEDVLVPDSLEQHHHRLNLAGFSRTMTWFQCFNFASFIAYR